MPCEQVPEERNYLLTAKEVYEAHLIYLKRGYANEIAEFYRRHEADKQPTNERI